MIFRDNKLGNKDSTSPTSPPTHPVPEIFQPVFFLLEDDPVLMRNKSLIVEVQIER